MIHQMGLQEEFFDDIKFGSKRIELRLFDEKRQRIQLGDEIVFTNQNKGSEILTVKVIGLLRYSAFDEIFNDFDMAIFADEKTTREDLLAKLLEFYPLDKQRRFGIIGIRFEPIAASEEASEEAAAEPETVIAPDLKEA